VKLLRDLKEKIENNVIYKIFRICLYVFVFILLFIIVVQKVTHNNLSVGGVRVFMIVSESMKGEYEIGDILISKSFPAEEINVGDNVTYLGEKGALKGIIITHKVVEKMETGGVVYFTTKGIANEIEDPRIRYDQIYGKVIYKTIVLSAIAKLMNNQLTYYVLFTLVALIISIEIVGAIFTKDDKESEEDDGE
jgi:signal peptidase